MANRYISLPDEINNRLKKEENASNLIFRLLLEYYKTDGIDTLETADEKLKKIEERRLKMAQELDDEESSIVNKKEIILHQVESVVEDEIITETKQRERVNNVAVTFLELSGRSITEAELDEYFKKLDEAPNYNIFMFLKEKGYGMEEEI